MVSPLSGLLVRPLTPADSALLSEALYHSLYTSPGEPPLPRELLLLPELARYTEGWGQRFGDQGMLAWRTPQTSIGAAWLRLFSHDAPGYGYVDDLTPELVVSVQPAWRGFGVGTQLILATLEQARPQFPAVSLSVTPGNPAVRLYERLGFEIVRVGPNDITMRRAL
ncbi:GNAT family N-acetyltransferase [Armatimonas rosea]|uniref:GNAT superfamily N-acetyltransferase n=1 Tax=Armatimonas rosea TaxID=685828 RepID=A0A7W9W591_ARMRO|nr:GNAT family N-acetyltransferase [Armatimonas rosea]MBB6048675.1 GNAT superfamily N-acetyltransferase [Armatimonas rosea]